ncbi:MAG: FadR family transcriptional regulator [Devosia sp.]|uniref:FadR/GntR family transcriptional regulator n=1 Tax=Devosia sp. TaxID=1871048 RepID=UPI00262EB99D|nr:GntR family transcriptional regulator [Devosia sp.]MDB5529604.1 FadR family transcriptional regulator [Devosia sp.]
MGTRAASDGSSQAIYEDLHRRIAEGALMSGARLPTERELAIQYGAARNTVRKTMVRLVAEGLIERHVGRGSFVTEPKAANNNVDSAASRFQLNELLEARLLFEPALAALVVERASDDDLAALENKLDVLRAAKSWSEFKEAKYALHFAIVALSHNSFLEFVFSEIIAARRAVAWRRPGPAVPLSMVHDVAIAENVAIVAALQDRNEKLAAELIKANLLRVFLSLSGT